MSDESAETSSLGHTPSGERWAFDESVTRVFEDMLARSIPEYAQMRALVTRLATEYTQPLTPVLDLGCSHGKQIELCDEAAGGVATYIGLDVSKPMLALARERLAPLEDRVTLLNYDLRKGLPDARPSVVLSVLTLQFVPINYRAPIVADAFRKLRSGGAMLLVEKVLGETDVTDRLLVEVYHEMKAAHGYTGDEIERKRLALEGVLVPVTASYNEESLRKAGFRHVECVWRWANFAAWVAVKERPPENPYV